MVGTKKKLWTSLLVAAATLLMATSASAQEGKKKGGDYGYWFSDDPLKAENQGTTTPQIRVLVIRHKEGLMKPRVAFVTELLKSVEGM